MYTETSVSVILWLSGSLLIYCIHSGDGEASTVNEEPADTGDYLSEREAKVDMFPQSVELDAVPVEQPLSTETADMGGAGGVAWEHQYNGELFRQL